MPVPGHVGVEPLPAVRAERLGHAEEVGARTRGRPPLRWKHGRKAGVAERREVGVGERRVGGEAGGLVRPAPEERHALPLEQLERAGRLGLRFGEQGGAGHERAEQTAAEAARPEEGHGDIEPFAPDHAAGLQVGRRGPEGGAVRVDDPLRSSSAA